MICLDKADPGALRHLSYNQSPPALAPGATTRQDLNGLANLREYVAAGQDGTSGAEADDSPGQTALAEKARQDYVPGGHAAAAAADAGPWLTQLFPRRKTSVDPPRLLVWAVSLVSALLIAYGTLNLITIFHGTSSPSVPIPIPNSSTPAQNPGHHIIRRSECASGGVDDTEYNLGLHVAALFIIWTVSTLGCAFPIMAIKFPGLRMPRRFFFAVRHFGTGVLIATAFCHLLPTAFTSLGNPCLGTFWTKDYEAMPGAIALGAIFLVAVVEMVFHPSRHLSYGEREQPMPDMGPLHGRESSIAQGLTQLDRGVEAQQQHHDDKTAGAEARDASPGAPELTPEQQRNKDRLQCILLEMGILFHSIFIGMALSVSIGKEFVVLLIAIVFHQSFEGLALGSRISAIEWGSKKWQPWLMALAYGFTTPIGQAIGLATHTLYSPDSEIGLIVVGVMNAISAGLLTFASLVELLSEDFLSDESWRYLRGRRRVVACLLVFWGAFFMSLVGAWA